MKIGFIGVGNMASAMMTGIIKNEVVKAGDIIGSDVSAEGRDKAESALGIRVTESNIEVVEKSDIVVLAVKPQYYESVIEEIRESVTAGKIIVSIAPGKTIAWLQEIFQKDVKIVRTMPNTPAMVLEGMTGVCASDSVTKDELENVCKVLRGFGKAEVVAESLMDVVVSVSGSSPAYVFMFIEAMADGAVADGMPRDLAYQFAAQAVLGSAKMVLESGMHPGALKDMVCSPGGTTIEAVRKLEDKGLRSAVIEAMKACVSKARGM